MAIVKADPRTVSAQHRPRAGAIAGFPLLIVREARGAVLAVYLMRSLAGALSAPKAVSAMPLTNVTLATGSMLLCVTCVYLYNGLTDLTEDRINGSGRPLATGHLTERQVQITLAALLGAVGAVSLFLPLGIAICNGAMLLLGLVYSGGRHPAKRRGTRALLVASAGATLPYLSAGLAATGSLNAQTLSTALLLGAWVWAGGAAKDLSDARGDAAAGRLTLPVAVGVQRARQVIVRRLILTATTATLFCCVGVAQPALLLMPLGAIVLLAVAYAPVTRTDRRGKRRLYRAFMATQYTFNGALILSAVVP